MLKSQIRQKLKMQRDEISANHREDYGYAISSALIDTDEFMKANVVLSFFSMDDELDISFFNMNVMERGKILAFPRIVQKGIMHAYAPNFENSFEKNSFGIFEPVIENSIYIAPEQIDLIVVPMLGFDKLGYRMGYGGGFYDRYLAGASNAFAFGVAYDELKYDEFPIKDTDVKLDSIITQLKRYDFK